SSDTPPVIDHGWLVTPWGRWFLTGPQWDRIRGEKNLPEGLLFMVGDNQFQSLDSRDYGYIQRKNLVGRVLFRRNRG
ncbi:MAG: S26 family signal peptidase, partial [Spirochaetaceae bacterium]|nr:S26 family signal peptidase [Spirochaetaceae bacterium]